MIRVALLVDLLINYRSKKAATDPGEYEYQTFA